MQISAGKKLLAAAALTLLMTGCATRSSVEMAQASANSADAHAADARGRADTAQSRADSAQARADGAQARADEAAGIGANALTTAQDGTQRVAVLETQLQKANARIAYLQRNVVMKKVVHKKAVKHHTLKKTPTPPKDQSAS